MSLLDCCFAYCMYVCKKVNFTDTISITFGHYFSGPEIFRLDSTNPEQLILTSPLDYETPTTYNFTIEAAEVLTASETTAFTSTATIIVNVLPANEYPPTIIPATRLDLVVLIIQSLIICL